MPAAVEGKIVVSAAVDWINVVSVVVVSQGEIMLPRHVHEISVIRSCAHKMLGSPEQGSLSQTALLGSSPQVNPKNPSVQLWESDPFGDVGRER